MRRVIGRVARAVEGLVTRATAPLLDRAYLAPDVPGPVLSHHGVLPERVIEAGDKPGGRILEIGSREVTGAYGLRQRLQHAEYVGFDYYPGPNVDVAGDAHRLSELVEGKFDVVYSTAVFEHLAMPWVVAEEIGKVLKVGGMVFIETHFSYASHERPWHFFQFSDMALRALFPPALGFECVEAAMQNPIVGRFSWLATPYLRLKPIPGLYCHSNFIGRKVREVERIDWRALDVNEVVGATHYPPPQDAGRGA